MSFEGNSRTCASGAVVAMKARIRLIVLRAAIRRSPAKDNPTGIDNYPACQLSCRETRRIGRLIPRVFPQSRPARSSTVHWRYGLTAGGRRIQTVGPGRLGETPTSLRFKPIRFAPRILKDDILERPAVKGAEPAHRLQHHGTGTGSSNPTCSSSESCKRFISCHRASRTVGHGVRLYRLRGRANLRSRSRSAVGGYAVSAKASSGRVRGHPRLAFDGAVRSA